MNATKLEHYRYIGELFKYPDDTLKDAPVLLEKILDHYPGTGKYLRQYQDHISRNEPKLLCEYYISTFDVQALCYLDIGYVLFGEDYKRGEFLVNLQAEYRKAGISWGKELPDHLPNLLFLISKNKNNDFTEELCWCLLLPALREMIDNFRSETNVYKGLLQMLLIILEKDFSHVDLDQYQIQTDIKSDFLDCIGCSWNKSKKTAKSF